MTAKTARVGFDWPDLDGILRKLQEEADELRAAHEARDNEHMAREVGDLLFVAVNAARFLGIDPETALRRSNRKFNRRFRYVESAIKRQGREPERRVPRRNGRPVGRGQGKENRDKGTDRLSQSICPAGSSNNIEVLDVQARIGFDKHIALQ